MSMDYSTRSVHNSPTPVPSKNRAKKLQKNLSFNGELSSDGK
jgi:hypothetical protein